MLSLKQYLDESIDQVSEADLSQPSPLFIERLEMLLASSDEALQQTTLKWVIDDFVQHHRIPKQWHSQVFHLIQAFKSPWLVSPLLMWLQHSPPQFSDILMWLTQLSYGSASQRITVIESLMTLFLSGVPYQADLLVALKQLDTPDGDVTDCVLQQFPRQNHDENLKVIALLGHMGRYRVIKPLICFAQEYPEYLRAIIKALSQLNYDEVNAFYLECLEKQMQTSPIVLIEVIKQVRRRRLRKAIPLLDRIFPMEDSKTSLINRAINGEIALTMASFGAYVWAREKLLTEMMLGGIHPKYLKAIEMLHLEDAVPLLKAILLMPETPEIQLIQQQAYRICDQLLTGNKTATEATPTKPALPKMEHPSPKDFLAF